MNMSVCVCIDVLCMNMTTLPGMSGHAPLPSSNIIILVITITNN